MKCHLHLANEMLANKHCGYIFTDIYAGTVEYGVYVAQTGIESQIM
jgi:hypothetical protein